MKSYFVFFILICSTYLLHAQRFYRSSSPPLNQVNQEKLKQGKWVELSGGYYSRGYEDEDEENVRSVYVGISLNFSRFFYQNGWKKTGKVLEYLQLPHSSLKVSHDLD